MASADDPDPDEVVDSMRAAVTRLRNQVADATNRHLAAELTRQTQADQPEAAQEPALAPNPNPARVDSHPPADTPDPLGDLTEP